MYDNTTLQVGVAGGQPVIVKMGPLVSDVPATVLLSADYTLWNPPGYPQRFSYTGAAIRQPGTVTAGTTIKVIKAEAAALVAAGAATEV
ncbi:hypothetical protein [Niveispirillum sp. KHB5.9]|uniref:hypothetical protein n=1 Tax=Niveispirillum sp. KHB5.9 TaxID=3400269 RepID=UPI003A8951ED